MNKKIYSLLFCLSISIGNSHAVSVFPTVLKRSGSPTQNLLTNLDLNQFLNLRPQDLKHLNRGRVTLKDKIVLKLAQKSVKRQLKKGASIELDGVYAEANNNFNIGGFLLGFFFSIIGVLVAILFGKNAVRSALLGALCGLLVVLIGWLI
jgi:hypothetical protein